MSILGELIFHQLHGLMMDLLCASQRGTAISYGTQSVLSVPLYDVPLISNKDYIFEVAGDTVTERPPTFYNLCQV